MVSITFSPSDSQFDSDPIADIQLNRTTFSNFTLVNTSINDNFTFAVFEGNGVPGAVPDRINV